MRSHDRAAPIPVFKAARANKARFKLLHLAPNQAAWINLATQSLTPETIIPDGQIIGVSGDEVGVSSSGYVGALAARAWVYPIEA